MADNWLQKKPINEAHTNGNVVTHEKRHVWFRNKQGEMECELRNQPRANPKFMFQFDQDGRDVWPPAVSHGVLKEDSPKTKLR